MTLKELDETPVLGLQHQHAWKPITTLPGLQSAHDTMRWDVSKGRIVSVNTCIRCDDMQGESVRVCSVVDCKTHRICARPYR